MPSLNSIVTFIGLQKVSESQKADLQRITSKPGRSQRFQDQLTALNEPGKMLLPQLVKDIPNGDFAQLWLLRALDLRNKEPPKDQKQIPYRILYPLVN